MQKIIFAALICTVGICLATGPGRCVLAEEFTATWCSYCPKAAEALDKLAAEYEGRVIVIAFHSDRLNDPFGFPTGVARTEAYKVEGLPAVFIDGKGVDLGNGEEEDLTKFIRPPLEERLTGRPEMGMMLYYKKDGVHTFPINYGETDREVVVRVAVVTKKVAHGKKEYTNVARFLSEPVTTTIKPEKFTGQIGPVIPLELTVEWLENESIIVAWAEDAKTGAILAAGYVPAKEDTETSPEEGG